MLYRAHLAAGIATGAAATAVATSAGGVHAPVEQLSLFALWVTFCLLPDLDVASVIQRWFYRAMLALLVLLLAAGRPEEAAFIATAAILPLVHHHRGWMHAYWAAIAVPLAAVLLWGVYWRSLAASDVLSAATVTMFLHDVMTRNAAYLAAMMGGYVLHLLIDRWAPAALRLGRIA